MKRQGADLKNLGYASLAVLCPACPQDGKNLDLSWMTRSKDSRYVQSSSGERLFLMTTRFLDALFYTIDGNFHANLRNKRMDLEDFPLSKGVAYFANEDAYAAYSKELPPLQAEVSPELFRSCRLLTDS